VERTTDGWQMERGLNYKWAFSTFVAFNPDISENRVAFPWMLV
jgi:hypothetical protein